MVSDKKICKRLMAFFSEIAFFLFSFFSLLYYKFFEMSTTFFIFYLLNPAIVGKSNSIAFRLFSFFYLMYLLYHKIFCLSIGFLNFFIFIFFLFPFDNYKYIKFFIVCKCTKCINFRIKICAFFSHFLLDKIRGRWYNRKFGPRAGRSLVKNLTI
jgi:hypothetical protein